MSITIEVSEETEKRIRRQAQKIGQDVEKVVGKLVEEVWEERFPELSEDPAAGELKSPFEGIGMFSSGKTDTSERMQEILYSEDLDPAQGFGTDR